MLSYLKTYSDTPIVPKDCTGRRSGGGMVEEDEEDKEDDQKHSERKGNLQKKRPFSYKDIKSMKA